MHQSVVTELDITMLGAVGSLMKRIDNSGLEQLVGAAPVGGLQLVAATLTVTPVSAAMDASDTQQLKAVMTDQQGNQTDVTNFVEWTSGNDAKATVTAGGLVTSVDGSAVGITADLHGQTDSFDVL